MNDKTLIERLDTAIIGCHDDKSEWGKLRVGDLVKIKDALTTLSAEGEAQATRIEALEAALREAATKICTIDHYAASDAWKIIKQAMEGSGND